MPRRQKNGFTWASLSGLQLLCRGIKRGLLRCRRRKGWSRADAACRRAGWQTAARKEGSRVDSLANTLSSLAFSQLLLTTSGWRWTPSVGLGWGPPLLCNGESKAEAFPHRFCSSEAGLVLGWDTIWFSESFPENLTSIHLGACSQRALSGQQGHTHILAKHIEYPKVGRKDCGLTPHAYPLGLHEADCMPEMESWLPVSLKQLGN